MDAKIGIGEETINILSKKKTKIYPFIFFIIFVAPISC